MSHDPSEDLFESTKMTFGEHLEELRGALFRSVFGLVVGTLLSLLIAEQVVEWIEVPLRSALDRFYSGQAVHRLTQQHGKIDTTLAKQITDAKLNFEVFYVERAELTKWSQSTPEVTQSRDELRDAARPSPMPPPLPSLDVQSLRVPRLDDLVPIRFWTVQESKISAFSVSEVFMIWMKAGIVTGFILSSPWIFYQIWTFVAAGLYPHEKKYVYTFLPISIGLFLAGAALAYFFVFRFVLDFLFSFNLMVKIDPEPRISEWLSFVLLMPIGFGISFQLPLVMFVLERVGIVPLGIYLEKWRIAVLVIFIISMTLTPADPMSMLFMALPLTLLYFVGIAMCLWMPRRESPFGPIADP